MFEEVHGKNSVEILLVEDNADDEELTLLTIEENNIANSIAVVRDGEEAVHYLFGIGKYEGRDISKRPKLILLDLKLPKMNGIEVLQQIKSNPNTKRIPVVVLTSSREEPDIARCYDLGANSYIVKPVDFEQFKDSLKQLGMYWLILNEPYDS